MTTTATTADDTKAWYLRRIVIKKDNITDGGGGTELPFSYATVVVVFYIVYGLVHWYRAAAAAARKNQKPVSYCVASHIVDKDHGDDTAVFLAQQRDKIQSDPEKFIKYANKCNMSNKGSLGKFTPGSYDPLFEQVCFDPATPLRTTVGPVHTPFGYHLIWIEERKLVKQ